MENNKSKRNIFVRYLDIFFFTFVVALFFVFQVSGVFEKLDFRLYDGMLNLRKGPGMNQHIVLLDADNASIQDFGEWPWKRSIFGDVMLRLKELEADSAVFDIEFLSPSAKSISTTVENTVRETINKANADINESINQFSSVLADSSYKRSEMKGLLDESVSYQVNNSIEELQNLFSNDGLYIDNDEYLSKCLKFFGNSWLTTNLCDLSLVYNENDIAEIKEKVLYDNVTDPYDRLHRSNLYFFRLMYPEQKISFSPALPKIMKGAKKAGFTNVAIDKDGTRRRIELLYRVDNPNGEQGKNYYLGQLVFAPLLKYLDVTNVKVKKGFVILEGARYPGEEKRFDLTIPLDENGAMIINWLHEKFMESFKHYPIRDVTRLDISEENIIKNLQVLKEYVDVCSGLLKFNDEGKLYPFAQELYDILEIYNDVVYEKDQILSSINENTVKIEDSVYKQYFDLRNKFYSLTDNFISSKKMTAHLEELKSLVENSVYEDVVQQVDGEEKTSREKVRELDDEEKAFISQIDEILNDLQVLFGELESNEKEFSELYSDMTQNLKGAICILGHTASSTTDLGATPFFSSYENVGVHANVLNTILQQKFIRVTNWYWLFAGTILIYAVLILIFRRKSIKLQNIVYAAVGFGLILVPFIFMISFGIYMKAIAVIFFIILNYFGGLGIRFRLSSNEKKFIRQAFSTYVSTDVVNEIIRDPSKALKLGGEEKNITALFTDVRKFSTFSELVSPEKLVSILNDYLGAMSDVILENRGTIDKYIGDSIVSFFGAPLPLDDHAYRACVSAINMKKAEDEFNARFLMENEINDPRFTKYFSDGLYSRIGINTGKMVAGNMGTTGKMNYTAMGNDMNLASRLEGVNKKYGSKILISDKTWDEVNYGTHKDEFIVRKVDKVRVVGISTPVQLYNIIGFKSEVSNKKIEQIDVFHEALDLYLKKDFAGAMKGFMHAHELDPSDETAEIFAKTCNDYITNGVPDEWDGIINLTSK